MCLSPKEGAKLTARNPHEHTETKGNRKMKKILSLILALTLVFALAACGNSIAPSNDPPADTAAPEILTPETPEETEAQNDVPAVITADRQGNPITLPDEINKIIAFGAANSEILVGLGVADNIIAVDTWTYDVAGLPEGLPMFDMGSPDVEAIIALEPDVMIITGMVQAQGSGDDMYKPLVDAGICVIYIPSSDSIAGIYEDIQYLGNVVGKGGAASDIISEMQTKIAAVKAIGDTITERKTVFFDLGELYSLGSDNFLNEMLELVGLQNIFADQSGWLAANDETILSLNPDIIFTSVNYMPTPVDDILTRSGWGAITAVANADVYYIDANASNRPSQHIIVALEQMASVSYPELYN